MISILSKRYFVIKEMINLLFLRKLPVLAMSIFIAFQGNYKSTFQNDITNHFFIASDGVNSQIKLSKLCVLSDHVSGTALFVQRLLFKWCLHYITSRCPFQYFMHGLCKRVPHTGKKGRYIFVRILSNSLQRSVYTNDILSSAEAFQLPFFQHKHMPFIIGECCNSFDRSYLINIHFFKQLDSDLTIRSIIVSFLT